MPPIWCIDLDDAGEKCLGDAVAVVGTTGQQQVFELIEGDHHWHLEAQEDFHEHLEQRQHQVLPARADLEIEFRKAKGQEIGQIALVAEQRGAGQALVNVAAHQARGVVRLAVRVDVLADQFAGFHAIPDRILRKCARCAPRPQASMAGPGCRSATGFAPGPGRCPGRACAPIAPDRPRGTVPCCCSRGRAVEGRVQLPAGHVIADELQRPCPCCVPPPSSVSMT